VGFRELDDVDEGPPLAMIDNGVGDLIRITAELPPQQWDDAARMLGFERAAGGGSLPPDTSLEEPTPTAPDEQPASPRQHEPASVPESALVPLTPVHVDTDVPTNVSWLQNTRAMRAPPTRSTLAAASQPEQQVAFEPLIPPHTAAGVIAAMLATPRDGALDTARAVRVIARRKPLRRLPRRARPTLARGAVVLTDTGDGLTPFAPDVAYVHDMVSAILGPSRVKVGWFTNDLHSGVWLDDKLIPIETLDPNTPVVILTDLGLIDTRTRTRCATLADIEGIAAHLADDVHAVALVPVPRDNLEASRFVAVVPWERPNLATVGQARRQARGSR
jgi:hypothetical protein